MTRTKTLIAALATVFVAVAFLIMASGQPSWASDNKVWVCKYVGTPGQDERLKAGKQPISVSSNATVGSWFNDAQGRSYVLAIDEKGKQDDEKYTAADCPAVGPTESPSPSPTQTTESPSPTATPEPTENSPSPTVTVSPSTSVSTSNTGNPSPSGPDVSESPDPELPVELADTGAAVVWLTAIGAAMVAFGYWLSGNKPRH